MTRQRKPWKPLRKRGAGSEIENRKQYNWVDTLPKEDLDAFSEYVSDVLDSTDVQNVWGNRKGLKQMLRDDQKDSDSARHYRKWLESKGEYKKRREEFHKWKANKESTSKDDKPKQRTVGTGTNGPEPKKKNKINATASEPAFTAAEFKEWYRGTGSAADKKVAKALRAQLGRSGYRKLEDEAIDNYTSRGHLSMFKRVSGGSSAGAKDRVSTYAPKATKEDPISEQSLNSKGFKTFKMPQIGTLYLRKKGKKGNGAYIKFKGKRNIQKADIDDYADFITGHNGLTKAQKKQLSSLGYIEYEEY